MAEQTKIRLRPEFCFGFACMLLFIPLSWCLSWFLAALVHELCHYGMLKLCGSRVYSVQVGFGGAQMETQSMAAGKEILCALAGPLGGLMLLIFAKWLPKTAVCAFFQSCYNLLPIYPLDGGRAVHNLLSLCVPGMRHKVIVNIIEHAVIIGLFLLSLYALLRLSLGITPLLAVVFLIYKRSKAKIPCKRSLQRVQ